MIYRLFAILAVSFSCEVFGGLSQDIQQLHDYYQKNFSVSSYSKSDIKFLKPISTIFKADYSAIFLIDVRDKEIESLSRKKKKINQELNKFLKESLKKYRKRELISFLRQLKPFELGIEERDRADAALHDTYPFLSEYCREVDCVERLKRVDLLIPIIKNNLEMARLLAFITLSPILGDPREGHAHLVWIKSLLDDQSGIIIALLIEDSLSHDSVSSVEEEIVDMLYDLNSLNAFPEWQ